MEYDAAVKRTKAAIYALMRVLHAVIKWKKQVAEQNGGGGFHCVTTKQNKTLLVASIHSRSMKNAHKPPHPGLTVLTARLSDGRMGALASFPTST